ncbi:eukaryotic translation initiation factor 5-like [Gigantopelta aegis]|uniref:eukaryotic translation initiation factor 5-like n=1 Tax=Gigantopelta aegis TaxID=1735272 RepID=UPI001B88B343|nr:eukaryotic translation initiation factor 5-like [Gigantopelta aegis]XP_041353779.1 eukaryotic translation initiation factor 5-like [Gigantopelta aegis]XP_041353781.1 eukaryotic translation initiation factor 5-like [Gigantopelta aegis]XP_041353782.1 eukaryotic translation initiation factor 5-like [Gigantopelta aegis]
MALNVDRTVADQFYRYKMPRLLAKVEGKGNGIKTVIVNMTDVAKALARPPSYPTKYFGCELGAQTLFDAKNDRYIVNGSHDSDKLQGLLDGFIKRFVLCPECSNPETNLSIQQKKQMISQRCIACGYQGYVDMKHKLTTYILKNPPDMDVSTTPSKGKKKKDRKQKGSVNGEDADKDRASPEANAQQQMAAQRASGGIIEAPPEMENDDEDWGEEISEEAIKQRMEELTAAAKGLAFTEDLEKSSKERINMLYQYIKVKRDSGDVKGADIFQEAERLEVIEKVPMVLVELLLDKNVLQQIKDYEKIFLRFCANNQKAQKYLLSGIELLVGDVHKEALLPKVPHILKALYDADILEEEVLLDWSKKTSKKYVSKSVAQEIHEKAAPFINWLKEAEEESEDDDDEDGTVEVVYSRTERVGQQTAPVTKPADNVEDDFDIDAI